MTNLVLLTNSYPFLPGDTFIRTEVAYLCQAFEQVHVIPAANALSNIPAKAQPDLPLPPNAVFRLDLFEAIRQRARRVNRPAGLAAVFRDSRFRALIRGELPLAARFGLRTLMRMLTAAQQGFYIWQVLTQMCAERSQPVILYSYWMHHAALGAAMLDLPDTLRVSRVHGFDLYVERRNPPYLPFHEQTINRLDWVCPISQDGLNTLSNLYPRLAHRLRLFRLGVEDGQKGSRPSPDGVLRVVSCSTLTPVKRVGLIADALALCNFPVHWTHFGRGEQRAAVEQKAAALPAHVQVELKGYVDNPTLLQHYRENPVDLFLNVSSSEGLPVTLMEAASYGIPIAATSVGGVNEIVTSRSGWLLPANPTPQQIADVLRAASELSLTQRQEMAYAAHQLWQERVNAAVQYPAFCQFLKTQLAQKLAS